MVFEEKTITSRKLYEGTVFNLRQDKVEVLHGTSYRDIIEHNGGSVICPVTDDNKIVMVKQYRKAAEDFLLEIPAGKIDPGEDPYLTAVRELKEETGYTAEKITKLTEMLPTPGYSEEVLYIYLAEGLAPGETNFDENEAIDIYHVPIEEAYEMVMNGEIQDGKSQVGILMTCNILFGKFGANLKENLKEK